MYFSSISKVKKMKIKNQKLNEYQTAPAVLFWRPLQQKFGHESPLLLATRNNQNKSVIKAFKRYDEAPATL
ncbi:hypothetical protein C1H46_045430 [Malus baccata]|uniref:Uncharacterized protein n=1 Tax=Malus baccata TaxID=106549 RepID=A0A540K485_MALBA|nr:hypothetical protein C1H46_045430 [Malus baccata]